jgi:GLPGLI family protein
VKFRILFFIAGLILLANYSCRERGGKYIDQGEIHYNIEYKGKESAITEMMPKTLVVSFKNNKTLFEIISPIGNSGIVNLANPEANIYDTYISFLGIKYYYSGIPGEINPGFKSMDGMELRKTTKTTIICGYTCKNAEVTFPADRSMVYNVWYTDEIKVKNSNISTPFREIEGVLMSFFFFMGKSELRFEAETVYKKEIPDKDFERKQKYKLVSKQDLEKFITDMVNL